MYPINVDLTEHDKKILESCLNIAYNNIYELEHQGYRIENYYGEYELSSNDIFKLADTLGVEVC